MTNNDLRRRLADWIEDVHECGPHEQMTDADLVDSLILFVEMERANAVMEDEDRRLRGKTKPTTCPPHSAEPR